MAREGWERLTLYPVNKAEREEARRVAIEDYLDELAAVPHPLVQTEGQLSSSSAQRVEPEDAALSSGIELNGYCNCCGCNVPLVHDQEIGESICKICRSYDVVRI
jgi:hypothetical protein